jgi:hypothetical protein
MSALKVSCFHSVTIAWSYLLMAGGLALETMAQLADTLTTLGFASYLPPPWLGRYTLAIGVITTAARMRSIVGRKEGNDASSSRPSA